MMSSFIPRVSSSPPPLDDGTPDDDWEDFGNFTGADDTASADFFHGHHKSKLENENVVNVSLDSWTGPKSAQIEVKSSTDTKDASNKQDIDLDNKSQFSTFSKNENFHHAKGILESGILDDGEYEAGTAYAHISTDINNKFLAFNITSTYASSPSSDDCIANKEPPADSNQGSMTDSGHGSSDFSPIQHSVQTPEFRTDISPDDSVGIIRDGQTKAFQDKYDKFIEDISSSEPSVSEGYMSNLTAIDDRINFIDSEKQYSCENVSECVMDDNMHGNHNIPFVRSNDPRDLEMDTDLITHLDKSQLKHTHSDTFDENDDDDDFQDFSSHDLQTKCSSDIHFSIGTSDSMLVASDILEPGTGTEQKVEGCVLDDVGTREEELQVASVQSTCSLGTSLNLDTKSDQIFSSSAGESVNTEFKNKHSADSDDSNTDNIARKARSDNDEDILEHEYEDFATFEVGLFYKSKNEASDTSWASFPAKVDVSIDEEKGTSDEDSDNKVRIMCCSSPEDKDNVIPAERTITESDFEDMDSLSELQSHVTDSEKVVDSEVFVQSHVTDSERVVDSEVSVQSHVTDSERVVESEVSVQSHVIESERVVDSEVSVQSHVIESERVVDSEVSAVEKKTQYIIADADTDDDFGDFSSVTAMSDNIEAIPSKPHQQEKFVEFSNFDSKETQAISNNDNWAVFSSGSSAEPSADIKFQSTSGIDDNDNNGDDEENQAAYSRVHSPTPTTVSFNRPVTDSSQNQSKLGRVKQAVVGCFPSALHLINEDSTQRLDHLMDSSITKSYRPLLWCSMKDMDNTDALLYHWSESTWNRQLFSTLKIDTRNILFGKKKQQQSYVPLTPLEPTKIPLTPAVVKSEDIFKPDPTQITTQEIPPAQFDWSSSGLVNPLAGANNNLNLDFLIQDSETFNKTSAIDSEFLVEPTSCFTKSTLPPLENILANMKTASTFKPTNQNETLSKEAQNIIQSLPDLTYLKAKVLMFPISSKSCD